MTTLRRGDLSILYHRQGEEALLSYQSGHTIRLNHLGDEVNPLEAHWSGVKEISDSGMKRATFDFAIRATREFKHVVDFDLNSLAASGVQVVILHPITLVDDDEETSNRHWSSGRVVQLFKVVEDSERLILRVAVAVLTLFSVWALFTQKLSGR